MQTESDFAHQSCSGPSTELVVFLCYIDPGLEHNGSMIRRRSEDQEEGGVTSGSWQDMAGVDNDSGKTVVAGGTSPAGQGLSRKTAQTTGALRRQKREESQTSRRGKAMEIWKGL